MCAASLIGSSPLVDFHVYTRNQVVYEFTKSLSTQLFEDFRHNLNLIDS